MKFFIQEKVLLILKDQQKNKMLSLLKPKDRKFGIK
jgi:hypothetical protein